VIRTLILSLVFTGLMALSAKADIYLAGSYQGWDPPTGTVMSDLGGGLYGVTLTGLTAGAQHKFKILDDQGGAKSWASNPQWTADDNWFTVGSSGNVTIQLNTNIGATGQNNANVGISSEGWTPQLVGNFMNEAGGAGDWNPADSAFNMTSFGSNLWERTLTISTAGTYEVKLTDGSGWDRQFGNDGYWANPGTFSFTTTIANEQVKFSFNSLTPSLNVSSVPEPGFLGLITAASGAVLSLRRRRAS
jgi:hypothetical protein